MSSFPSKTVVFVRRVPALLAMEGWHEVDGVSVKISCRFRDILRCSEFHGKTMHFKSCFGAWGSWNNQPLKRCLDPTWAIVYVPDKHGNFMGRCFIRWMNDGRIEVGKVYGNKLNQETLIKLIMIKFDVDCLRSSVDTYL